MPEYTNLNDVIVDGRVESSAQGCIMGSFSTIPAASASNADCIVLYTGTSGTYIPGQFYKCVGSGSSYSWQPVTISGTEEDVYTASRVLVTDGSGRVTVSGVTTTELNRLDGVTSGVQSQINSVSTRVTNLQSDLGDKVDKVSGMGLSQNSYTTTEKNKLAGIESGADVNKIETIQNNGVTVPISNKTVNITHPTKLSEFVNDSGFITSTVSNLSNYYTRSQVNSMINAIPEFSVVVRQSGLPSSGNDHTIYLVPKSGGSQDAYDEYLYVNGQWEKIGSTAVSFSFDQSGTNILINGTAIRNASASQSGLMTTSHVSQLSSAVSDVSNLQSQYGSLNSTVSGINTRLGTVESTLSTTVSRVSTLEETPAVENVSGTVTNGSLTVSVNDVESDPIALPTGGKQLVTSGDITQFVSVASNTTTVNKEFDIEYIHVDTTRVVTSRKTISKGSYPFNIRMALGSTLILDNITNIGTDAIAYAYIAIYASGNTVTPYYDNRDECAIINTENTPSSNGYFYRLYA